MRDPVRYDGLVRNQVLDDALVLGVQLHRQRAPKRGLVFEPDEALRRDHFRAGDCAGGYELLRVHDAIPERGNVPDDAYGHTYVRTEARPRQRP